MRGNFQLFSPLNTKYFFEALNFITQLRNSNKFFDFFFSLPLKLNSIIHINRTPPSLRFISYSGTFSLSIAEKKNHIRSTDKLLCFIIVLFIQLNKRRKTQTPRIHCLWRDGLPDNHKPTLQAPGDKAAGLLLVFNPYSEGGILNSAEWLGKVFFPLLF